jgi:Raf kinase inhibitor-like YbhB/YbcL family protein
VVVLAGAACSSSSSDDTAADEADAVDSVGTLELTSQAFVDGAEIPIRHTCDGADASPPLAWAAVPDQAVELVLIVDDPDAPGGSFTHWVVYRISAETTNVGEAGDANLINGVNSFGDTAWGGPCPPEGDGPHTYSFVLRALGEPSGLDAGASLDEVEAAIAEFVIDTATLTGTYER